MPNDRPPAVQLAGGAPAGAGRAAAGQLVDELYRGHALRLTRMALLLVGDRPTAEDVVQEAFLGLFRGLGLQQPRPLRYFLDLSDNEIAADLGVSRGTVVSTASRALSALARKAGEQA